MSNDRSEAALPFPTRPGGTVTFLHTDIEGSTRLLNRLREEYADLLAGQRKLLRDIFTKWSGHEVDTQGDSFFVAFPRGTEAVGAAVEILVRLPVPVRRVVLQGFALEGHHAVEQVRLECGRKFDIRWNDHSEEIQVGIVDAWAAHLGFETEDRPVESFYKICLLGDMTVEGAAGRVRERVRELGQEAVIVLGTADSLITYLMLRPNSEVLLVTIIAALLIAPALQIAYQWERAVVLRLGKFKGLRKPGVFVIVPIIDKVAQFALCKNQ